MPCTKCEEGNYKWGETGECKYDTLQDCESANSKYNKMQPTPLGKKSYEEYEKELKEYNLSKVEKVELGEIDDLKKISNKAGDNYKELISDIKKLNQLAKSVQDAKKIANNIEANIKSSKKIKLDYTKLENSIRAKAKGLGIDIKKVPEVAKANEEVAKLVGELDQADQLLAAVSNVIVL